MTESLTELANRVAYAFSTSRVRECVNSLRGSDVWERHERRISRVSPYPMSVYLDDPNLYYAIGWGCHQWMMPHERWLVRRAAALRARGSEQP